MATFASTTKPPMANQMNGNGVTQDDLFDPSPDIHGLFVQFNQMYFLSQLGSVELAWSKRMTLLVYLLLRVLNSLAQIIKYAVI